MTKILIVEDEWIIANDIRMNLQDMGYEVAAVVSTGEKAIKLARDLMPDLILMDIMLEGDMDGIDTAKHIHQELDIPFIYLTAYSDKRFINRSKETEPFGYLLKPFKSREIQIVIEIALYKHKMERNLKESQKWLSTVFNSITDAVITTDFNGLISYLNPSAVTITGWNDIEAKVHTIEEVFSVVPDMNSDKMNPFIDIHKQNKEIPAMDYVLTAKNGEKIYIEAGAAPIRDDKDRIIGGIITFRDITKKREMQQHMKATEQLTALGRMAAGVAHELNNPLTGILTFAKIICDNTPKEKKDEKEGLELIVEQTLRCSRIISGLLGFSSNIVFNKKSINVNKEIIVVIDTLSEIEPKTSAIKKLDKKKFEKITITPNFNYTIPDIIADSTQIQELIINLLHNASDAITGTGNIYITTNLYTENNKDYIEIQIKDTGHGIKEQDSSQVFEPFFTTRAVGQGTGLGLAVSHGIVKMHGGTITFKSELNVGTTFFVRLPVTK
ncbi:MAG: response regulator [Nitrospirae bacterium]|nr:response regulator [Nitrospirota bacterium]